MSNNKKSREEKIIADIHRQTYTLNLTKTSMSPVTSQTSTAFLNHSYLAHDLSKTGILTAVIIGLQIILFFLFKKHLLILPDINY